MNKSIKINENSSINATNKKLSDPVSLLSADATLTDTSVAGKLLWKLPKKVVLATSKLCLGFGWMHNGLWLG